MAQTPLGNDTTGSVLRAHTSQESCPLMSEVIMGSGHVCRFVRLGVTLKTRDWEKLGKRVLHVSINFFLLVFF